MRLRPLSIAFLVCICAPLAAQTPAASATGEPPEQTTPQTKPPAQPPATAVITGTVFCSDTHRPARGALVMAQAISKGHPTQPDFGGMTRVGLDGTYSLTHLHAGDYSVIALLPGYLSPLDDILIDNMGTDDTEMRDRLVRNGVISVRNDETAHFDVTLQRGATVSGRVLYDDGAPATQVILAVEDVNAKPPAPKPANNQGGPDIPSINAGALLNSFFLHQNQGTDDQGNFRISGIKPGTYRIAATPSTDGQISGSEGDIGFVFAGVASPRNVHIYSGDTFHKNAAKKYELRAGDEVNGIEITIPVYAFHRIEGHLTSLDGRPVVSAALILTDTSDDSFALHAHVARDGAFVLPQVPAGTYKLAVTSAISGTLPENFPENYPAAAPIQPGFLQNMQSLTDKTTTVLVKDSDITDLSIQLQNATPTPNQPTATSVPTAAPQ